jgi:hypothetical protein
MIDPSMSVLIANSGVHRELAGGGIRQAAGPL